MVESLRQQGASSAEAPAVSIVLPTFNESETLPVLIPRIAESLSAANLPFEVVVVDDGSPDGTADVAEELGAQYPVRVIRRRDERGLATAVLTGFDQARAPICVVMDADGSHPPSALPAMVRMIQLDKADIVVGSRNIEGGGSRNWPLFSQLKSKLAAALTFALTNMTDPTTGLMALRKSLLPGLTLDPVGWKIVLEIVVKAAPVRVAEVPILFEDRELGQSKQSLHIFAQYVEHLLKLYAYRYRGLAELATFCAIGLAGLFLDLGTVIATKELTRLDTRLCAVFGFAVAVTANFILNRRFTFAHGRDLPWLYSYLTYVGTNLLGLSVRVGVVHGLMEFASLDRGHGYVLSNAIGIVLATGFNFIGAKYFAFDPERLSPTSRVTPATGAQERRLSRGVQVGAALVLSAALGYTAFTSTATRRLQTDDEGVNVTMAGNILADPQGSLLRPSVYPGGRSDWLQDDLPALGNTPFYPGLLALAGAKHGLGGMGLLPWLSLLATLAFSALLFLPQSPRSALYTGLLLASSPAFLQQALSLEFEPTLTAFCAAGLYFLVRGTRSRHLGACFAGGALLGLGFLTKLWLIAPFALACCGFALVQTTLARERDEHPLYLRRSLGVAIAGFALTACAHLALLAVLAPRDLPYWVQSVYLGIFSGHGVTGGKLSAAADYAGRPVWYYPAVLYEQHFHLLPLAFFGLPALLRRARVHAIGALAMAFGTWLSVIVLSVPAVKEPLYVFAVAPLWYVLAGTCLAELENDSKMFEPGNRIVVQTVLTVILLGALARLGYGFVVPGASLDGALVHAAGLAACAAIGAYWMLKRELAPALLCACALSLAGFIAASERGRGPDPQQAIAAALQPVVQSVQPAYPSFVAPHSKLLMGYLGRAGSDWQARTLPELVADPTLRAFVLGPEQQSDRAYRGLVPRLEAAGCSAQPLPEPAHDHQLWLRH